MNIMRSCLLFIVLLTIYNCRVYSEIVDVKLNLSKTEILSGEPMDLVFEVHNTQDRPVSIRFWYSNYNTNEFQICVLDSKETIVHNRRILKVCPASQKLVYHGQILPSETILFTYPIQLQVFTDLPIGSYSISPMQLSFRAGIIGEDAHIKMKSVSVDFPKIPFEVINNDQTRLYDIFKELEQKALYAEQRESVSWVGMDFLDIWPESRTLLWAYGPMAVDAQIALIYDKDKGFRFWPPATIHAWDNIARHANPEQIKKLIEIIDGKKFIYGKWPSQDYDPGIIWCFHEIAKNGTDENKALAQPIAEKYKNNIGFKSMEYGMDSYGK